MKQGRKKARERVLPSVAPGAPGEQSTSESTPWWGGRLGVHPPVPTLCWVRTVPKVIHSVASVSPSDK